MSATTPFFITEKEINLIDHLNEELIDEIVGQSVDIYKSIPLILKITFMVKALQSILMLDLGLIV